MDEQYSKVVRKIREEYYRGDKISLAREFDDASKHLGYVKSRMIIYLSMESFRLFFLPCLERLEGAEVA
jgi:hypothetical protein